MSGELSLQYGASGWELPVTLRVKNSDGEEVDQQCVLPVQVPKAVAPDEGWSCSISVPLRGDEEPERLSCVALFDNLRAVRKFTDGSEERTCELTINDVSGSGERLQRSSTISDVGDMSTRTLAKPLRPDDLADEINQLRISEPQSYDAHPFPSRPKPRFRLPDHVPEDDSDGDSDGSSEACALQRTCSQQALSALAVGSIVDDIICTIVGKDEKSQNGDDDEECDEEGGDKENKERNRHRKKDRGGSWRRKKEEDAMAGFPSGGFPNRMWGKRMQSREMQIKRDVNSLLNKICPERMAEIVEEIAAIELKETADLETYTNAIFTHSVNFKKYSEIYADLMHALINVYEVPSFVDEETERKTHFRGILLHLLQQEVDKLIENCKKPEDMDDRDWADEFKKVREKAVGCIRIVGNLYLRNVVKVKIISAVVTSLVFQHIYPEELLIELAIELITAIGYTVCTTDSGKRFAKHLMCRLAAIRKDDRYSFRLKTLIDNVVDKWRQGWVVKVMRGTEAKTLGEIHKEAALDNAQEQAGFGKGKGKGKGKGSKGKPKGKSAPINTHLIAAGPKYETAVAGKRPDVFQKEYEYQRQEQEAQKQAKAQLESIDESECSDSDASSAAGGYVGNNPFAALL